MRSHLSRATLLSLICLLILVGTQVVFAASFTQDQKLTSADFTTDTPLNIPDAHFGDSIALHGNWMAAGIPGATSGNTSNAGAVYLYERVAGVWEYRTRVSSPAPQSGSEFGASVDIYESGGIVTIIAGAPLFDAASIDQGRAFVFVDTDAGAGLNFPGAVTISPASPETNGRFGYAVALFGDNAAISEPNDDVTNAGLVSIRGRNIGGANAWGSIATKTGNLGNGFGTSVDLHGEYLIVGAPYASNGAGIRTGQAYVYRQDLGGVNAWGLKHSLTPATAESDMTFGFSVGIWDSNTGAADSASRSAVGAPFTDNAGFADVGSVVFFNDGVANFTRLHLANANNVNAHLGYSVALDGDNALAGRPSQTVSSQFQTGQVDTFSYNGTVWATNTINLTQTGAVSGYFYGHSVDVSGLVAVIGAPGSREDALALPPGAVGAGIVETLEKPGPTWAKDTDSYVRAMFDQPNTAVDQYFGSDVAMTDTWLAVGVKQDGQKGSTAGAVYMYRNIGGVWTPHSKLTALYGQPGDFFGTAVAISGTRLIVGAPGFDGFPTFIDNAGAVYLYEFNGTTWVQTVERTSPNAEVNGNFGESVDFHGDVIVAGAPDENGGRGRAYAFRDLSGLTSPITLAIAGASPSSGTAISVSVFDPAPGTPNDEVIALGAYNENSSQGAAYVLSGATFSTVTTLVDPSPGTGRFFGLSVSIFNGRVAVGAPTGSSAPSGRVVVFSGSGYSTADTMVPSGAPGQFGYDVDLDDSSLVVGSPATAGRAGLAHVFARSGSTWTEQGLLQPGDLAANDEYGIAVTQANGQYVIGGPLHNANSISNSGAAYVFSLAPEVTVTPTTLAVDETGPTTDTFLVSLNQAPPTNVTIQLTFDTQVQVDTGSGFGASPQTVTLTPANATTGITVSVRAVDDPIDETTPHSTTITTATTVSATPRFNGLAVADVTVDITDNDTAGVTITQTGASTAVTESGTTDTYTIVLDTQPTATVNVAITFPAADLIVNGDTDGTFNTTFTTGNWDTAQTITVAAVNDRNFEGDHSGALDHAFTSADALYQGITAEVDGTTNTNTITVSITDNETMQLVWQNPTGSGAEGASYTQNVLLDITADPAGGTPINEVALNISSPVIFNGTAEAADVTIEFLGATQAAGQPDGSLVAAVYHTLVDDTLVEGPETFEMGITLNATAVGLTAGPNHGATITDGDSASVTLTGGATVSEAVGTTPLTVTLTTGAGNTLEQAVTVAVNLVDNTATYAAGAGDFSFTGPANTVNVTFPAGSADGATQVVNVNINEDVLVEGTESFSAQLGAITGPASVNDLTQNITITDNEVAAVEFQIASSSVGEATTPHTVVAILDISAVGTGTPALGAAVSVGITQTPNGATTPEDYTLTTTSITFPAAANDGALQNIDVAIVNDGITEPDHDFSLGFGTVTGAATASGTHVVTILDDDIPGINVTQSGGNTAVVEGGATDSYTVTLGSEPSAQVDIALVFDPAQLIVNGDTDGAYSFSLNSGNYNTGVTVTVVAVDDTLVETNPHSSLIVQTASSADPIYNVINPADVTVSITENDFAEIVLEGATSTVAETDGQVNLTARLNLISNGTPGGTLTGALTAQIELTSGTASFGTDFGNGTVSVSFPNGTAHNATLPISIPIINDRMLEAGEDFTVSLSLLAGNGSVSGANVVTITDDETGVFSFNLASDSTPESTGIYNRFARLTITGSGDGTTFRIQDAASIALNHIPNTAGSPVDYSLVTTSLNVPANAPSPLDMQFDVSIVDDALVEADELFAVSFGAITGNGSLSSSGSHMVTITENDSASVSFTTASGSVAEGGGTYNAVAQLDLTTTGTGTPGLQVPAILSVGTAGSATFGPDYSLAPIVIFTPADADGATFNVVINIVQDPIDETDETIDLTLSPSAPVTIGAQATHTVTIIDDDTSAVIVTESGGTTAVTEGGTLDLFDVVLATQPTAPVNVALTFDSQIEVSTDGINYFPSPVNLFFTPGDWNVTRTVTVQAVNDTVVEGPHASLIALDTTSGDLNYNLIATADVNVSITDNDTAEVIFASAGFSAIEGALFSPGMTLKVTANGAPGGTIAAPITVNAAIVLGTAEASDAILLTAVDTFPAGSVHDTVSMGISIQIVDDLIVERTEDFTANLSIGSGQATTSASNVYQINSDDTAAISYSAPNSSAPEATTPHSATALLTLGGTGSGAASIEEAISAVITEAAGTATTPADYTLTTTSISFPAGSLNAATAPVSSTIVNDALIEGPHTFTLGFGAVTTDMTGVSASGTHVVTITDDDFAGVTIVQTGGSANVTEGSTTDTFTLTLNAEPTSDVTITFDVGAQVTFAANPLVIAPANWNVPQTVTVTAVDDIVIEGPHSAIVGLIFTGDADFAAITPNSISVTVNITDNDVPGVVITESGTTDVIEGGATDTYDVVLLGAPTQDVTITLTSVGAQLTLPAPLTFTPANYNVPQTITVQAVDDGIYEGSHTDTITHTLTSLDLNYNGFPAGSVTVFIGDGISELILNGSFETPGATAKEAQNWKGSSLTSLDRRICNPSKAFEGSCAFQFNFSGPLVVGRKLKQVTAAPAWGFPGETLTLNAQVSTNGFTTGAKMRIKVIYDDATVEKVQVAIPAGTYPYSPITTSLTLSKRVTKAIVMFKVGSAVGRVWIDDVSFTLTPAVPRDSGSRMDEGALPAPDALPLPLPMRRADN